MKETNHICFDIVIIGGGPAGTGLLLKALKDGARNDLFERRIALVEKSSQLVIGNITQYKVNSDTLSDVFLECLEGETKTFINSGELSDEIEFITSHKGRSIPLSQLEPYLKKLGTLLQESLTSAQKCEFFMNTTVDKVVQNEDDTYTVHLSGKRNPIKTGKIVLATGGVPKTLENDNETFAQTISLSPYRNKIIHSDAILKLGLSYDINLKLKHKPKVVILGGSHSAFSAAHYLLNGTDGIPFMNGDIQMWSKTLPKIYFNSKQEALECGYNDFGKEDFCPVTGKLYRLAGLRMDGRELYIQMLGAEQSVKEKRVVHNVYTNQTAVIEEQLKTATLIISAYGYELNMIPLFNSNGNETHLKGKKNNHWVNDNCELMDENEIAVPNIFASGLATGFIPKGELGGEPSFSGQTNGIWYYQNAIADLIMRNLGVVTS